jgi:hypothetical protein
MLNVRHTPLNPRAITEGAQIVRCWPRLRYTFSPGLVGVLSGRPWSDEQASPEVCLLSQPRGDDVFEQADAE